MKTRIMSGLLVMAAAQTAWAVPIPALDIDFRDAAWATGHGQGQYTVGGITVDALPDGGFLLPRANLSHSAVDGFGVTTPLGNDEIDGTVRRESLEVRFDPTRYDITGAWVSNLFANEAVELCFLGMCIELYTFDEFGAYEIDGGSATIFTAASGDGNLWIDLSGLASISSIAFYVPNGINSALSDFSVVGFTAAQVPEPAILGLLGLGLLTVPLMRRRIAR